MPGFVQFYSTFAAMPPARGSTRRAHDWSPGLSGVLAPKVRHRQRPPQRRRHFRVPDFWPLRRVVVPGARVEVAELLVLELVELDVELDVLVVGVAVVDRDVVAGPMPHRPPVDGNFTQ